MKAQSGKSNCRTTEGETAGLMDLAGPQCDQKRPRGTIGPKGWLAINSLRSHFDPANKPTIKILVDGGDSDETLPIRNLLGFIDGQPTNPLFLLFPGEFMAGGNAPLNLGILGYKRRLC